MTVSTLTNRVVYTGNGAATSFAVPFKVLDIDHLVVHRREANSDSVEYTYVGTDFSYSGLGNNSGTLTLAGPALTTEYELVIERTVPYTQELDIVNAGGFYPETVEEQLDLMVMQIQQIAARPDLLTPETLAQDALNVTRAVLEVAALAAAAAAAQSRSESLVGSLDYNDRPAIGLAGADTNILIFDVETAHANNLYIRNDATAANDYEGTAAAFFAGVTPTPFNVGKNVVDQKGNTVAVAAGAIPYDWTYGKAVKIDVTDLFKIPATEFGFGSAVTMRMRCRVPAGDHTLAIFYNAATTQYLRVHTVSGIINAEINNGGGPPLTSAVTLGTHDPAADIDILLRLSAGGGAASLNNEPWRDLSWQPISGAYAAHSGFAVDSFQIANGASDQVFLKFLAIKAGAITDAEMGSWFNTPGTRVVASAPVLLFKETFAADGGERAREPNIFLIDDGAESRRAVFVAFSMQRFGGVGSVAGESSARLVGRLFTHEFGSSLLTAGSLFTFYEPTGWTAGKGHSQSPVALTLQVGTNRGKTLAYVHDYDGVTGGTAAGDAALAGLTGKIYGRLWDKTLKPGTELIGWTMARSSGALGGYLLPGPGTQMIEMPEGHPHAGRVVLPVYGTSGVRLYYIDPATIEANQVSLSQGALPTGVPANYVGNEGSIVLAPNGDVLLFTRVAVSGLDAQNALLVYRSPAATVGQTLAYETTLDAAGDSYEGAAAAPSAIQLDLEGRYGPLGRVGVFRPLNVALGPVRHGCKVSFFEDTAYGEQDETNLLSPIQTAGYVAAVPLYGGTHAAVAYESDIEGGVNARGSCHAMIVTLPTRGNTL